MNDKQLLKQNERLKKIIKIIRQWFLEQNHPMIVELLDTYLELEDEL